MENIMNIVNMARMMGQGCTQKDWRKMLHHGFDITNWFNVKTWHYHLIRYYIDIHCTLCNVHCEFCFAHCALCIVHFAFCIVHWFALFLPFPSGSLISCKGPKNNTNIYLPYWPRCNYIEMAVGTNMYLYSRAFSTSWRRLHPSAQSVGPNQRPSGLW